MLADLDGRLMLRCLALTHVLEHLNHEGQRALIEATGSKNHLYDARVLLDELREDGLDFVCRTSLSAHANNLFNIRANITTALRSVESGGLGCGLCGESGYGVLIYTNLTHLIL